MNNGFVCSFSSKIAELKPRQKRNPILVLSILSKDPYISTFDMSENNLYRTLDELKCLQWVTQIENISYPWHKFEITEKGYNVLKVGHPTYEELKSGAYIND
jgi:hypothetical protein